MKERIVINQDWLVKDMKAGVPELDKLFICQKVEQVPESFADLKELCKDLNNVAIDDKDTMDVARIRLFGFGITYFEDYILMIGGYKKTSVLPAQMWQIIKNLIGEE